MEKLIHKADGSLVSSDPLFELGHKFLIYGDSNAVGVVTQDSIDKTRSWRLRHRSYLDGGGIQQAYINHKGLTARYAVKDLIPAKD